MNIYSELDYCKTDLISTKGVVFCKFFKASSALAALEDITDSGMVSNKGALSISMAFLSLRDFSSLTG